MSWAERHPEEARSFQKLQVVSYGCWYPVRGEVSKEAVLVGSGQILKELVYQEGDGTPA